MVQEAVEESKSELIPWCDWCFEEYALEDTRGFLQITSEAAKQGEAFEFAIFNTKNSYLGGCGINQINKNDKIANLGYWVRTSEMGRGLALRATRKLIKWVLQKTDLNRLEIVCAVGNTRSQKVAEKLGAQREGIARSRLCVHGIAHDAVVYSVVRHDFNNLTPQ